MHQHESTRADDSGHIIPSTARSRLAQRMNALRQQQQHPFIMQKGESPSASSSSSPSSSPSFTPSPNRFPLQRTHRNNLPSPSAAPGKNGDKLKKKSSASRSSSSDETKHLSHYANSPNKKKQFIRNDAASLVKDQLVAVRQSTISPSSTAATTRETQQSRRKFQGNKIRKGDKSTILSTPSDSETISPRQMELRKFLSIERSKRRHEREMKDLLLQHGTDDFHAGDDGKCNCDVTETEAPVEENDAHDECKSDETLSMNEVGEGVNIYEGPPEMDVDEQLYSTIRKKRTSKPHLSVVIRSADIPSPEPECIKQNSGELNSPKEKTKHIKSELKSRKQPLQSETILNNNPMTRRGDMFSFFVPIEYGKEPIAPGDQPVPLIHLGTFTESAWLEFGDERMNVVGKARSLPFDVHVPEESKLPCYNLQVERVPIKKGFSLGLVCDETSKHSENDDDDFDSYSCFTVHRGQTKRLFVTWIPNAPGGLCETIYLKFPKGRVRVTVRGNARAKKSGKGERKTNRPVSVAGKKVDCTNNDKKKFTYLPSPRHFLSISTERSWGRYDDRRATQQDEAYKIWLNHVFKSPEMHDTQYSSNGTLRAILSRRRQVQATQCAQSYFRSPEVQRMKGIIDDEVFLGRLTIRTDHDVFANVNLRSQLIALLMSYTAPWLKIGLETIFGESITVETSLPNDGADEFLQAKKATLTTVLKKFIVERLLSDPVLKMKYTKGKCNIPSGRFERRYKDDLNGHTLRKTLTLITFLDGAKRHNVLPSSIRLFRKNAIIKATKDFLHILCRDYIHGIGNLNKHLQQLGVSVSFEQSPLDELDFFVANLATDLRDGIRLGKLAEVLGDSTGVIEQMRIPAISRLQKVFNVDVALSALSSLGVPNVDQIHPNYIVDGHRPQVLKMLWSITLSFQINNLLDKEKLRDEIYAINRSNMASEGPVQFSRLCGDIESCNDICDLLLVWCDAVCSSYNLNINNFSESFADGRAVCFLIHYYHPAILKFTDILPTHFSSRINVVALDDAGREKLFRNERRNCSLASQKMVEIGGIPNMLPITDTSHVPDERTMIICVGYLCARLLESSKESSAILVIQNAVRLYLNRSRMSQKWHAVHVIERAWIAYRSVYYKRQRALYLKPVKVIEAFLIAKRPNFQVISRQRFCVTQMQKIVRGYLSRKLHRRVISERHAVISMQKMVRGYLNRKKLRSYKSALVKIQSFVRIILTKRKADVRLRSIVKIQYASRNLLQARKIMRITDSMHSTFLERTVDLNENCCEYEVSVLPYFKDRDRSNSFHTFPEGHSFCTQSLWRRCDEGEKHSDKHEPEEDLSANYDIEIAAKMIQKVWKLHLKHRQNYINKTLEERCAVAIQSAYRRNKCRAELSMSLKSARIIQKWYKCEMKRKNALNYYATLIQAHWRRFSATLQYRFDLSDIVFTQSLVRQRLAKARFNTNRRAIILLQSVFRQWLVRNKSRAEIRSEPFPAPIEDQLIYSATILQKYWRRYVAYMDFHICRNATISLQRFYRSRNLRQIQKVHGHRSTSSNVDDRTCTYTQKSCEKSTLNLNMNVAATKLQRIWRGYNIRLDFLLILAAARKIQIFYRAKYDSVKNNTNHHVEHNSSVASETKASITTLVLRDRAIPSFSMQRSHEIKKGQMNPSTSDHIETEDLPYAFPNWNIHRPKSTFQSDIPHHSDIALRSKSLLKIDANQFVVPDEIGKENVFLDTSKITKPKAIEKKTVDMPRTAVDKQVQPHDKRDTLTQSQGDDVKLSNNECHEHLSMYCKSHESGRAVSSRAVDMVRYEDTMKHQIWQETGDTLSAESFKQLQLELPPRQGTLKPAPDAITKVSCELFDLKDQLIVHTESHESICTGSLWTVEMISGEDGTKEQRAKAGVVEETVDILSAASDTQVAPEVVIGTCSSRSVELNDYASVHTESHESGCAVDVVNCEDGTKDQIPMAIEEEAKDIPSAASDKQLQLALSPRHTRGLLKPAPEAIAEVSGDLLDLKEQLLVHTDSHESRCAVSSRTVAMISCEDGTKEQKIKAVVEETLSPPSEKHLQLELCHIVGLLKLGPDAVIEKCSTVATPILSLQLNDCPSMHTVSHESGRALVSRLTDAVSCDEDGTKEQKPKDIGEETADTPSSANDKQLQLAISHQTRDWSKSVSETVFKTRYINSVSIHCVETKDCASVHTESNESGRAVLPRPTDVVNHEDITKVQKPTSIRKGTVDPPSAAIDKKVRFASPHSKRDTLKRSQEVITKVSTDVIQDVITQVSGDVINMDNQPTVHTQSRHSGRTVSSREFTYEDGTKEQKPKAVGEATVDPPSAAFEKKVRSESPHSKRDTWKQVKDVIITVDRPSVHTESHESGRIVLSRTIDVISYKDGAKEQKPKAVGEQTVDESSEAIDEQAQLTSRKQKRGGLIPAPEAATKTYSGSDAVSFRSVGSNDCPLIHEVNRHPGRAVSSRTNNVVAKKNIGVGRLKEHEIDVTYYNGKLSTNDPASVESSDITKLINHSTTASHICDVERTLTDTNNEKNISRPKGEKGNNHQTNRIANPGHTPSQRKGITTPSKNVPSIHHFSEGTEISHTENKSRIMSKSTTSSSRKADHLLGPRTKEALEALKSCKSFQEVIKAMRILENTTKLSISSRKAFAHAGAHSILYDFMRSCNRSAPHIELLECILRTLFNVSKHKDLISYITTESSVDTFIDIIQMFRDKDEVFSTASMILKRIVWSDGKYLSQCRKKENMKRILGVYKLLKVERHGVAINDSCQQGITDDDLCKSGIRTLSRILEKCMSRESS